MKKKSEDIVKTAMQVVAILCLAGIVGVILHKAHADITALSRQHGSDFWSAFARHMLRNLAGG